MHLRWLVSLYLFHHIEGVCKPWSAATEAARVVLAKLAASIVGRDDAAAVARAEAAGQARQARAVSRTIPQRPAAPGLAEARVQRALGQKPVAVDPLQQAREHVQGYVERR